MWAAIIHAAGQGGPVSLHAARGRAPALADAGRPMPGTREPTPLSSLVVVVGIGGGLMGFTFLDAAAAIIVGFMILQGRRRFWLGGAARTDRHRALGRRRSSASPTMLDTPGVLGLHELRTRRMAHQALVDAHVQVDGRISVSEGHRMGETRPAARARSSPRGARRAGAYRCRGGSEALMSNARSARSGCAAGASAPVAGEASEAGEATGTERVVLHYLGNRVEAEVPLACRMSRVLPAPTFRATARRPLVRAPFP